MAKIREKQNIPSGWQEKNLDAVCNIINGSTPKRSVSEYWENGTIPWFTVDDIRRDGRIIYQTQVTLSNGNNNKFELICNHHVLQLLNPS